jgi:hypothetical protein
VSARSSSSRFAPKRSRSSRPVAGESAMARQPFALPPEPGCRAGAAGCRRRAPIRLRPPLVALRAAAAARRASPRSWPASPPTAACRRESCAKCRRQLQFAERRASATVRTVQARPPVLGATGPDSPATPALPRSSRQRPGALWRAPGGRGARPTPAWSLPGSEPFHPGQLRRRRRDYASIAPVMAWSVMRT